MSTHLSIRSLTNVGVRELGLAAIAQSVGVSVFLCAAVIYGLISFNAPPESKPEPSPPTDYQLTPAPMPIIAPGEKPAAIVNDEGEQYVQALKDKMKAVQAGADYRTAQVEFVVQEFHNESRLAVKEVNVLSPKELLGRTIDFRPHVFVNINADSIEAAKEAANKLITSAKSTPTEPFAVFVTLTTTDGKKPLGPSFGLIKTNSRLVFTDNESKIYEVFANPPQPSDAANTR